MNRSLFLFPHEKNADKKEAFHAMNTTTKNAYLSGEVNKLQDSLQDSLSKAMENTGNLDTVLEKSRSLLKNSKKFYKKSRKTYLYQNGYCGCIFILISEFFSSIISCLKKAFCCCCTESDYESVPYKHR